MLTLETARSWYPVCDAVHGVVRHVDPEGMHFGFTIFRDIEETDIFIEVEVVIIDKVDAIDPEFHILIELHGVWAKIRYRPAGIFSIDAGFRFQQSR